MTLRNRAAPVVEKIVQTADHVFDVRIALGELVPDAAQTSRLDLEEVAQRLLRECSAVTSLER
jgi:hypothetical protein